MSADVLIIDDEPEILSSLARFMQLSDIECDTASDPQKGIEMALAGKYFVILMDINMPKMDGLEVLSRIKEKNPQLEIVMMTAYNRPDQVMVARKLGASDFLLKPFVDMEQINNIVLLSVERAKRWQEAMNLSEQI